MRTPQIAGMPLPDNANQVSTLKLYGLTKKAHFGTNIQGSVVAPLTIQSGTSHWDESENRFTE
jgi:hypothetical protein